VKQFDFSTLRVFAAVAETGSFSKAAARVHLAVAAVSRRIADLEDDVATPLFVRHARGVELTPAGRAMLQHAREILFDVERMRADMSDYSRGARGHVRLGAITSAITQYLPEELKRFTAAQPQVRVELRELTSDAIVAALSDHLIDIGIVVPTFAFSGLETYAYHTDQLALVVPRTHRLAPRKRAALADALDEPFVGLAPSSSMASLLGAAAGERMNLRVHVRSFDAMCRMIQAGIGLGVLPLPSARLHVSSMGLRAIPLSDEWARRTLLLAVRKERLAAPAASLLEHLRSDGRVQKSSL
jgi:DNA-binding transcriptional LysR family regulator